MKTLFMLGLVWNQSVVDISAIKLQKWLISVFLLHTNVLDKKAPLEAIDLFVLFCIGISYRTTSNQNTMMTVEEKSSLRLVSWPSSNIVSSTLVN